MDGVTLAIEPGSFTALLGGSGSGKTTTLKTINGLVDARRRRGAGGRRARSATRPAAALRRRIGYVFQEIGLFPHMTVAENIGVGPRLAGWAKADDRRARRRAAGAGRPAATASAARLPAALSGGQRQRVGVARALAAKPAIMLMDEPFGALDPVTRDALGRDYRALHERLGLTTLMVTHDVSGGAAAGRPHRGDGRRPGAAPTRTPAELLAGHADARGARADGDAAPPGRAGARAGWSAAHG